jgi:hypothetical protein
MYILRITRERRPAMLCLPGKEANKKNQDEAANLK